MIILLWSLSIDIFLKLSFIIRESYSAVGYSLLKSNFMDIKAAMDIITPNTISTTPEIIAFFVLLILFTSFYKAKLYFY